MNVPLVTTARRHHGAERYKERTKESRQLTANLVTTARFSGMKMISSIMALSDTKSVIANKGVSSTFSSTIFHRKKVLEKVLKTSL